jgi:bisphosphoglycerate-independent phosphoglycerate mutase (AlkP superfamily)
MAAKAWATASEKKAVEEIFAGDRFPAICFLNRKQQFSFFSGGKLERLLADVAPTALALMEQEVPEEMTGEVLISLTDLLIR